MKIGLLVIMVGIAAINRFRLRPRLAATAAIGRLQRNSKAKTVHVQGLGLSYWRRVRVVGQFEAVDV